MDKLKPYALPGVAALLYLAWWLFAPKVDSEPQDPATGSARPTTTISGHRSPDESE